MSEEKKWQLELATYIRQGEPKQAEKSEVWRTAIGLQAVRWFGNFRISVRYSQKAH